MGIEDFIRRDLYISNQELKSKSQNKNVNLSKECVEKVDEWLKDNSEQTWVATRHMMDDISFQRTQIHEALKELSVETWNPDSETANVFLNPYNGKSNAGDRG